MSNNYSNNTPNTFYSSSSFYDDWTSVGGNKNYDVVSGQWVVIKDHTEYAIVNTQWKLMNEAGVNLYGYLRSLRLTRNGKDMNDSWNSWLMNSYIGIGRSFYLRNVYRHEYRGGVESARLDPWNRKFLVFPGDSVSGHGRMGSVPYSFEYFHCPLWGDDEDVRNVYVITTTVHRSKVYCVDILQNK